jgi:hypothetical protein
MCISGVVTCPVSSFSADLSNNIIILVYLFPEGVE